MNFSDLIGLKIEGVNHIHTDLSNGTTNIDSVTKYQEYVDRAVVEGLKYIAFTEHGNIFEWYNKKLYCEKNGIKYIHAIEMYMTKDLNEKVRDNYHICLFAKNFEGFKELNKLISKAYNRQDGHFYYVPRITFKELTETSDNIIISTACIGGGLRQTSEIQKDYLDFLARNKHRCFLEVQHHMDQQQIDYNIRMSDFRTTLGIPLIVGTDTHALNEEHVLGRTILQRAKDVKFDNESGWDISWQTSESIVYNLVKQEALNADEIYEAMTNTKVLMNMIEDFTIDRSYKYPQVYDNPLNTLKAKINQGIIEKGVNQLPNYNEYLERIKTELETYIHNDTVNFLLLDEMVKTKAKQKDIFFGPGRGSVSGSVIAWLIGVTEMDSIKRKLNFERFMNKDRVSLADIDSDWPPSRRQEVKDILYDNDRIYCSEIITFNTVKLKGSIRDVGRALNISLDIVGEICKHIEEDGYEDRYRKEYPELFKYVDIISGTVVSVGVHPAGTIVSPIPLDENLGLITTSTCDKPVSMIEMNEVNDLFYVKLDILGLENIEIINETCKLAQIPRVNPDNLDPDDERVWKSIRDNTLGIFQWNGSTGTRYIKHLFNDDTIRKIKEGYKKLGLKFSYMDLFSVGNGAIRPGGASYRDALAEGLFYDNGHDGINRLLAPTLGYLVYQEQIMDFLVQFCDYGKGEADIVRRAVAKKKNSEQYLPEIERRFIKTMQDRENMEYEKAEKIIQVFLKVILDSSDYLFSLNHSDAYSWIGYECGWLREYYPFEFLTVMMNSASGDLVKTKEVMDYAKTRGISIQKPEFGKSKGLYFFDKSENSIYKGIGSVKYMNDKVCDQIYEIYHSNTFNNFIDVLNVFKENKVGSRAIETLIKIGYFNKFGTIKKLLKSVELHDMFYGKKQFSRSKYNERQQDILQKHSNNYTDKTIKEVNITSLLYELFNMIPNTEVSPSHIIEFQSDLTGTVDYINEEFDDNTFTVIGINTKYTPTLTIYKLNDGSTQEVKVSKSFFSEKPLKLYDTIYVTGIDKKNKRRKIDDKWVMLDEYNYHITYCKMN